MELYGSSLTDAVEVNYNLTCDLAKTSLQSMASTSEVFVE